MYFELLRFVIIRTVNQRAAVLEQNIFFVIVLHRERTFVCYNHSSSWANMFCSESNSYAIVKIVADMDFTFECNTSMATHPYARQLIVKNLNILILSIDK